jgi:hypothetical protein
MRKNKSSRKLVLNRETVRLLSDHQLGDVVGGAIKTRNGCTKKNSECNACPELQA